MLALTVEDGDQVDAPRREDELEREGYVAEMFGALYMAKQLVLNPGRHGLLNGIKFDNDLYLAREQDPISIVRETLEQKLGFTMREFAEISTSNEKSAVIDMPPKAAVNSGTRSSGMAEIVRTHGTRRMSDSRNIEERIFAGLKNLHKHLDPDTRNSKLRTDQICDALAMGAPLIFDARTQDALFMAKTLEHAVSAESTSDFLDRMRDYCATLKSKLKNNLRHRNDPSPPDLRRCYSSPLIQQILRELNVS
jgi:hypothetical protein